MGVMPLRPCADSWSLSNPTRVSTAFFSLPRAAGVFHAPNSSAVTSKLKPGLGRLVCGCLSSEKTSKSCVGRDAADLSQSPQPKVILMAAFQ